MIGLKNTCYVFLPPGRHVVSIRPSENGISLSLWHNRMHIEDGFKEAQDAATRAQKCNFSDDLELAVQIFKPLMVSDDLDFRWHRCSLEELYEMLDKKLGLQARN